MSKTATSSRLYVVMIVLLMKTIVIIALYFFLFLDSFQIILFVVVLSPVNKHFLINESVKYVFSVFRIVNI